MPDRFGKISIHQSPTAPPDAPESIAVQEAAPPKKPGKPVKEPRRSPRKVASGIYWLGAVILLFALYLAAGFLALPRFLATSLPQSLKESTTFLLDPGIIAFNPLTFHFSISQAKLSDAQGTPIASLGHLAADLAPISLLRLDLVCNTVTLSEVTLHLTREKDGSYNFSPLLGQTAKDRSSDLLRFSDLPFLFSLNNIVIKESKVLFLDAPTGKTHTIDKLHMELPSFSNIPFQSDEYLRPSFSAVINGSPVELAGKAFVGGSGEGATTLTANLHGLDLPLYAEYLPLPLPLVFTAGKIDGTLDFIFDPTSQEEDKLAIDFSLQAIDAEFNTEQESLFVTAPLTEIAGRVKPMARSLAFSNIASQKTTLHTFGNTVLGSFDPLFTKDQPRAATATSPAPSPSSPLALSIDKLTVAAGAFHLWKEKGDKEPLASWNELEVAINGYDSQASPEQAPEDGDTFILKGKAADSAAAFSWQGKISPSRRQVGELLLSDYDLAGLLHALGGDESLGIQGNAAVNGTLTVSLPEKAGEHLGLKVADAELTATDVQVREGKQVVFEAPTVRCSSLATALKTIHFGKIRIDNGTVQLPPETLPALFRSFSGGKYLVHELVFSGQVTALRDREGKKKSVYTEVELVAKNLDTLEKAKENLTLTAKTTTGGAVSGHGDVRLAPFSVVLDTTFTNIAASEIFPLVSHSPLLAGLSGTISGKGNFGFPKIGYSGDLAIAKGSLPIHGNTPLTWTNLVLQGLNYSRQPVRLGVVAAHFEEPQFSWKFDNHQAGPLGQFADFLRKHLPDPPAQEQAEEAKEAATPPIDLQTITFKDGSFSVLDPRVKPKWKGDGSGVSGSIKSITSGTLAEGSPFSLSGKLQDTDFTIDGNLKVFSQVDSGEYHLTLDHYPLVSLREQLTALSEVDTKNGYATLKLTGANTNGQFLVSGSATVGKVKATSFTSDSALTLALLTDPDDTFTLAFDLGDASSGGKTALIEDLLALFQTKVVKASVSPLLLASGDYADLIGNEFISFEPGQALLSENGTAILGRYAELLQSHPLLGIELSQGVDRDSDVPVLKEQLMARERQRVEEENRKRYQEWLKEKEIFDQKVAEQQKKLAAKAKPGETLPAPAVLKDYIPLQPKTVNVDNAMLLDLARQRLQMVLRLLTEQFAINAARLTIEPLKKVPNQEETQIGPAVKIALVATK